MTALGLKRLSQPQHTNALVMAPRFGATFEIMDGHLGASITQMSTMPPVYLPPGKRFTVSMRSGQITLAFEDDVVDEPVAADPPACIDCVHLVHNLCTNPKCATFDPVNGRRPINASDARKSYPPCGPSGRAFEAAKWYNSIPYPVLAALLMLGMLLLWMIPK